jgi:serine phosphatase RsbU (regulator of sigma subunit)
LEILKIIYSFSTSASAVILDQSGYLFFDGYADQFGGTHGKNFKSGNLKKNLLSIASQSMTQQVLSLQDKFEVWMGDLEQLDDICIIGVEV